MIKFLICTDQSRILGTKRVKLRDNFNHFIPEKLKPPFPNVTPQRPPHRRQPYQLDLISGLARSISREGGGAKRAIEVPRAGRDPPHRTRLESRPGDFSQRLLRELIAPRLTVVIATRSGGRDESRDPGRGVLDRLRALGMLFHRGPASRCADPRYAR